MKTEITPLLIVIKLEQFDYSGPRRSARDAGDVVRDAVRDQLRAGLGPPPACPGGSLMAGAATLVEQSRRVSAPVALGRALLIASRSASWAAAARAARDVLAQALAKGSRRTSTALPIPTRGGDQADAADRGDRRAAQHVFGSAPRGRSRSSSSPARAC
jgi:hypothetical protein